MSFGFILKCNKLNYLDYRYFQNCDESWYCIECCSIAFPFNSLSSNKNSLACCTNTVSNITQWKYIENDYNSKLSLKSSSNLELLVNNFNNATQENGNAPEIIASSKYNDTDKMHNIAIPHKYKSLLLFYINAYSLHKHFDDLHDLLSCTKQILKQ